MEITLLQPAGQLLRSQVRVRDHNSPALYTENVMANFAINNGMSEKDVTSWRTQLAAAEKEGHFGFASFPVLTNANLTC